MSYPEDDERYWANARAHLKCHVVEAFGVVYCALHHERIAPTRWLIEHGFGGALIESAGPGVPPFPTEPG